MRINRENLHYVSRNPFAREELFYEYTEGKCYWCGNTNKRGKVKRFYVESDGGRINEITGVFCSKDFMRTYYG